MADAGIDLHMLQRVAGHKDPAVTPGYLHPDTQAVLAAGSAFSVWWSLSGPQAPTAALPAKTPQSGTKECPDLRKQIGTPHGRADSVWFDDIVGTCLGT